MFSTAALRNAHGIYFVNSRLSASYPTIYNNVGGTTFYYHHPVYEPSGRERMVAKGPTNETLYVMVSLISWQMSMVNEAHVAYCFSAHSDYTCFCFALVLF